jgi:hypothetical protein
MPRSLGSVYGGAVTRFLGGSLRGVVSRVIDTPGVESHGNGVAVSRNGCRLLVSVHSPSARAIHTYDVASGKAGQAVGSRGPVPGTFDEACQVWVADDDCVFVADSGRDRVRVLSPRLAFCGCIGEGVLSCPGGVCVDADVVVVSEIGLHRLAVFSRSSGALRRRFGSFGSGDGELNWPHGLCFTGGGRSGCVAVAEFDNHRVSVFTVDGRFVRHVGAGALIEPKGVACSAADEIVVADSGNMRLCVFSDVGELLATFGGGYFCGVAVRGGTVFASDPTTQTCTVFV